MKNTYLLIAALPTSPLQLNVPEVKATKNSTPTVQIYSPVGLNNIAEDPHVETGPMEFLLYWLDVRTLFVRPYISCRPVTVHTCSGRWSIHADAIVRPFTAHTAHVYVLLCNTLCDHANNQRFLINFYYCRYHQSIVSWYREYIM